MSRRAKAISSIGEEEGSSRFRVVASHYEKRKGGQVKVKQVFPPKGTDDYTAAEAEIVLSIFHQSWRHRGGFPETEPYAVEVSLEGEVLPLRMYVLEPEKSDVSVDIERKPNLADSSSEVEV